MAALDGSLTVYAQHVTIQLEPKQPGFLLFKRRRIQTHMTEPAPRFWEIFFEVYENLPRQGPGNRDCASKALSLCSGLPEYPAILDLGCGVGGQTLQLAQMIPGSITAVDSHAPSIERLRTAVERNGLSHRVSAVVGDMARLKMAPESFDLIWSEGALYSIGLADALCVCRKLLRPGGCLAFTLCLYWTL